MAEIEVRSSGERVEATLGDSVVIRIPENATTGYRWVVTELPETLEVLSDESLPPTSAQPGAGGEHRVALTCRGEGEGRVVLSLERPWEGEAADRFELSITVS